MCLAYLSGNKKRQIVICRCVARRRKRHRRDVVNEYTARVVRVKTRGDVYEVGRGGCTYFT